MTSPIVLIHGLWLTPRSWEGWKARFEQRGHEVLAPAWPRMEREVEALRRDPSVLNGLGLAEVVDHYERIIRGLDTPPVIMGHSTGGLLTELLLDRGLGAAGVALSPAPVKGVLRVPPALLRTVFPALRNPANRKKTVPMTPKQFRRGFTNTMNDADAEAAYARYYVPAPGRVIFQAAFANLNPHALTKVDFHKDDRPPLLVMGNDQDNTIPASVSKEAAKRLGKSKAVVDYKEFAGRPHFTAGAPGWEAVADYALDWANRHVGAPADDGGAGEGLTPAASRVRPAGAAPHPASTSSRTRSGPFSLLKRSELVPEASHRVVEQEVSPAHPCHAERGKLGERRRLRHAHDVHRAADLRHEGAQRVGLPQDDRVHAVDAGLEVGIRAPQRLGNKLLLGPGAGTGEQGTEEDVDPGVDHELVAVLRRRLAHRPEPLRVPRGIAEAAGGVVGVLEVAAGGPGVPQRSHQLGRRPSRTRPRRRRSRAPRRPVRSARPRRASRRPAHARGPHSRARRPRRRWSSRPRETRPRPRLSPWPRPRRSEAGAGRRDGAASAAVHTGSRGRPSVRRSCEEPTPRR